MLHDVTKRCGFKKIWQFMQQNVRSIKLSNTLQYYGKSITSRRSSALIRFWWNFSNLKIFVQFLPILVVVLFEIHSVGMFSTLLFEIETIFLILPKDFDGKLKEWHCVLNYFQILPTILLLPSKNILVKLILKITE